MCGTKSALNGELSGTVRDADGHSRVAIADAKADALIVSSFEFIAGLSLCLRMFFRSKGSSRLIPLQHKSNLLRSLVVFLKKRGRDIICVFFCCFVLWLVQMCFFKKAVSVLKVF